MVLFLDTCTHLGPPSSSICHQSLLNVVLSSRARAEGGLTTEVWNISYVPYRARSILKYYQELNLHAPLLWCWVLFMMLVMILLNSTILSGTGVLWNMIQFLMLWYTAHLPKTLSRSSSVWIQVKPPSTRCMSNFWIKSLDHLPWSVPYHPIFPLGKVICFIRWTLARTNGPIGVFSIGIENASTW